MKLGFRLRAERVDIGQIAETSYIAATRPDHPARDLKQFVDWAKANAGKANFASGGPGSSTHLNGELLNSVAGRGHQTVFRIYLDYPGKTTGIPQYLLDAGLATSPTRRPRCASP